MIQLAFSGALVMCMAAVIIYDAARYIIPNSLNLVILLLYGAAIFLIPGLDPLAALGAAAIILVVGLGLFALGLMGGGDIKLLVVLALWTGWSIATFNFIMLTAVLGGLLVVLILLLRAFIPPLLFKANPARNIPRLLTKKEPVPYGLAIAGAFLVLLFTKGVPALM